VERVLVIGDVIDDIIVVPEGQVRANTDTNAQITQSLGGSASNMASWASHEGALFRHSLENGKVAGLRGLKEHCNILEGYQGIC
jgi:hypothetical protein